MGKKKTKPAAAAPSSASARKKKEKGKTQVHPYTMMMVIGPTGKKRMEKRYK